MAVFYLLYSVMWKKWNHSKVKIILFNFLALALAFLGTAFREESISFLINIILLFFVSFILLTAYKESKDKKKGKKPIYDNAADELIDELD